MSSSMQQRSIVALIHPAPMIAFLQISKTSCCMLFRNLEVRSPRTLTLRTLTLHNPFRLEWVVGDQLRFSSLLNRLEMHPESH